MTRKARAATTEPVKRTFVWRASVGCALAFIASTPFASAAPKSGKGARLLSTTPWTLAADVRATRGLAQGAPIYEMFTRWEIDDPIAIARTLSSLADDATLEPTTRVLARSFAAASKVRLGDVEGARSAMAESGYVSRWLSVGPFDHEGRAGFAPELGPERDRFAKVDLTKDYDGKDHHSVRWRLLPSDATAFGVVDLASTVRPSTASCSYALTFVSAPAVGPKSELAATMFVGASGAVRIDFDGERVLDDGFERALTYDREATRVSIGPGWHRVLVKVCGIDRSPSFALRFADDRGAPLNGLVIDPDVRHAAEAIAPKKTPKDAGRAPAAAPKPADKPKPPLPAKGATEGDAASANAAKDGKDGKDGKKSAKEKETPFDPATIELPFFVGPPRTRFLELLGKVKTDKPAAADLEALARHLDDTDGDDPTKPIARDLARRAADLAPSAPRLLLAGALVEDRNQRRVLVEKAAALAPSSADVIYAQAQLVESGPDPDAALPLYERALADDPHHLLATIGRIDVHTKLGLRRLARKELDEALFERPRCRALLAREANLLDADAPVDAAAVRERYDALSINDGTTQKKALDAAIGARSVESVRSIVGRWRSLDPSDRDPIAQGARALSLLGDLDGAAGLYQAGLAVSPDDPALLIALGDVEAQRGHREEQLALYKRVLARYPQATTLRDYLEHAAPSPPREDEKLAEEPAQFLPRAKRKSEGFDRRILSETTVVTVQPSGLSAQFHQIVYQPMTAAAALAGQQYSFGYQADRETVTLRSARVHRADGKIDEAAETFESRNDDPSISMYTSARIYTVRLPKLQPGDVVELRYRVDETTARNAFGDYFGDVPYLQNAEPTHHLVYVLKAPKTRALSVQQPKLAQITFTQKDEGESRVLTWTGEDVPGIVAEAAMPPWPEIFAHAHVSTYASWDALGAWYWGLVKDQLVADEAMRTKVTQLTAGLKDDAAKVRAIYGFIVQQTRYVALEFGIKGFQPYRCSQIFARGFGDCKDKASLLVTMLGEAGIDATPVLVRTGQRGDIDASTASLALFDHMIAYVPSLDLYLDGTAEDHGSTELPVMDRGALAVRVDKGKPKVVHLPQPAADKSVRTVAIDIDLTKDFGAAIEASLESTGWMAPRLRGRYRSESTQKQHLGQDVGADVAGAEWSTLTTQSLDEIEKTPSVKAKGKASSVGRAEGKSRSFAVSSLGALAPVFAPLSSRSLPVSLQTTQSYDDRFSWKLPAGVTVLRAPESKRGTSPFGHYEVEVENGKGQVKVRSRFSLTVARVEPADYAAFRAFLRDADAALGQRLLLGGAP